MIEVLLLDGISGFLAKDLLEVDLIEFKRLCYTLANFSKGRLLSFEEPHVSQIFYKAELGLEDGSVFLLLSSSYPFVAFASSVQYFDIDFVDD